MNKTESINAFTYIIWLPAGSNFPKCHVNEKISFCTQGVTAQKLDFPQVKPLLENAPSLTRGQETGFLISFLQSCMCKTKDSRHAKEQRP